ncbi:Uncharacterised protein [Mycobacteroides abscessus subsp. abscessus]|nr:Uncharacterised protein [Mycobacteroides abscessus subsp. abscessus]
MAAAAACKPSRVKVGGKGMPATPAPNRAWRAERWWASCASPRIAVRASSSSSRGGAGAQPSLASNTRSSAYSQRAAEARSEAL